MANAIAGLDVDLIQNNLTLYLPSQAHGAMTYSLVGESEDTLVYKIELRYLTGALTVFTTGDGQSIKSVSLEVAGKSITLPTGLLAYGGADVFAPATDAERKSIYNKAQMNRSIFNPFIAGQVKRHHPEPYFRSGN